MANYFCPRCGAPISEGFLQTVGETFDCPACKQKIELAMVAPGLGAPDANAAPRAEMVEEESPTGGRIQSRVIGPQLVLYLRPGSSKQTRGIGCFAIMWLGIVAAVTSGFIFGEAKGNNAPVGFLALFFGVFWLVGLTMLYLWLRGRFGKTYLLFEPDRLVLKSSLFGREKFKEYSLTGESRAELVESYKENERPVYAVSVSTTTQPVKFGTFLSDEDKQWLVARINRRLGREVKETHES